MKKIRFINVIPMLALNAVCTLPTVCCSSNKTFELDDTNVNLGFIKNKKMKLINDKQS